MTRYRPSLIVAAVLLAALAGFGDALAWIKLGGFFASFMSGNTTQLAVAIASADGGSQRLAGALILAFICGVMIAAMLSARFVHRRKPVVMAAVTLLLALAATLTGLTDRNFPLILLAMAMGAENGVFARDGEVSIGLTYMTGTLVKVGQKLAGALIGADAPFAWTPYLVLWLGFAVGALFGARAEQALGDDALWVAAGAAGLLTLLVGTLTWRTPVERESDGAE